MELVKQSSASRISRPPVDLNVPAKLETATFALGWFWGPDAQFGSIEGVVRTRVGYSGGKTKDPTYYNLADHTETIQIDYNPAKISYGQLLDIFWQSHKPGRRAWSNQYKAAVFYRNEEQKRLALASRDQVAAASEGKVHTEIISFSAFYLAEDYHQKYRLQQQRDLFREFKTMYPNMEDLVNSTAAARVNGYLDGYGNLKEIEEQVGDLGLSPEGARKLVDMVKRSRARWGLW